MKLLLLLVPFLLLTACGQVASVLAYSDGGCRSSTQDSDFKVQHLRVEDGNKVRCIVEFEVKK